MMRVNTRGASSACVAFAVTRSPVNSCRFFFRIETTSTDVQLHSAINTASIGLGPCLRAGSASKVIVFPLSLMPSKTSPCFHSLCAIILGILSSRVIRHGLGMNRRPRYFMALSLKVILQRGNHLVHPQHAQLVRQRAMARNINVVSGAKDGQFVHIHN